MCFAECLPQDALAFCVFAQQETERDMPGFAENYTGVRKEEFAVKIRRAEEKDIPEIDKLLNQVNLVHHKIRPDLFKIGRKYSDSQLKELLADDSRPVFAAVDEENRLIGYCMCAREQIKGDSIRTEVKTLYIDDLCVDQEIRGQHIGQKLFEHVKQYAEENHFYNVTLHVWQGNDGAEKFYEAMGMKPQFICMEQVL